MSLALALVLIVSPEPVKTPEPALMGPVKQLALALELLDPREAKYWPMEEVSWEEDLRLLRQRYQDLRNAPYSADALRFPDPGLCRKLLSLNREYRRYLEQRQALLGNTQSGEWVQEAIEETDCLYQIWEQVRDSQQDYFYVTVRRKALQNLRDMIGPAAYYGGFLPSHVPTWRFRRAD